MQRQFFLVESDSRDVIPEYAAIHFGFDNKPFANPSAAYHHGRTLAESGEVKCAYLLVCYQDAIPGEQILRERIRKELIVPVR